ncbi:MAG: hypothetical protein A2046_05630 [Bacteroidetes bacterium GWA2_30_7]|nr:MAG: hypothetical protein A2046_05630 [Bacteroidetes bacterium GWA2_30_7]
MIKFFKQYYLLSALFVAVSCTSNYNSSNVKEIDSLIVIADSIMLQITYFNLDTLKTEFENIKIQEKKFQANLDSIVVDTIVKKNLMVLGRAHKSYKSFIKNYNQFLSECNYSLTQLKDLKNDTKENILKKEEFSAYFEQEKEAIFNLSKKVNFHSKDIITSKRLYLQQKHLEAW